MDLHISTARCIVNVKSLKMASQVLQKRGTAQVGDLQLDVVCLYYTDRVFLVVTHLDKMGTMVSTQITIKFN